MSHFLGDTTITGNTASGGTTAIESTSHATKGTVTVHTHASFNNVGQLTLTGADGDELNIRSGNAGNYANLTFGRTSLEARFGIAASAGQFSNGVLAAGDIFMRTESTSNLIVLQSGTSNPGLVITGASNIKIGGTAVRGTTEGTNQLVIFNGTAPAGTVTNGVSIYSASGKLKSADAAGTIGHIVSVSSVNSVSPTAQNRTLTVDIGGTTYYITAKTTND